MATVYRARDARLGVWRAIKVLSPAMTLSGPIRERFESEARMLAQLRHPNIVAVLDVGEDDHRFYMVMELVDGGTLDKILKAKGALSPGEALWIMDGILAGLDLAHAQGVVHRDIKPENILLTRYATPKLADFGIARQRDEERNLTRTGSVLGTWAFMAPEQRTDAKSVDARADLYAVAATLFNLVTGRDPFDLYTVEVHDELFDGVPASLRAFISKASRYKPADRYPSAAAMREALRALGDEFPLRAPEIPEVSEAPTPTIPPPEPPPAEPTVEGGEPLDGLESERSGLTDHGDEGHFPRWLGLMALLAMVIGLTGYWKWQHPEIEMPRPRQLVEVPAPAPPPAPVPEPVVEAEPELQTEIPKEQSSQKGKRAKPAEENPWGAAPTAVSVPSVPAPMNEPVGDVARIVVQSQPPGQEVFVNRVSVGRTPYTATVTARRNRITIVGPNEQEQTYTMSTSAGDIESVCYDFDARRDCKR